MDWTINALWKETGVDRRTIEKRLEGVPAVDGKYPGKAAFAAIYGQNGHGKRPANILESEARISAARAIQEEVAAAKVQETVIEVDVTEKAWQAIISAIRQKIITLPTKVESQYRDGMTGQAVRKLCEEEVDEILSELSRPVDYSQSEGVAEVDESDS